MQLFPVFSPLVPNISLSTMFSAILSLYYYSLNVRDQVPVAAIRPVNVPMGLIAQ
jgi:hypothetical protein